MVIHLPTVIEALSAKDILSTLTQSFDAEKESLLSQIRDGKGNVRFIFLAVTHSFL